jgi:hypothetical protein
LPKDTETTNDVQESGKSEDNLTVVEQLSPDDLEKDAGAARVDQSGFESPPPRS